MSYADEAAAVSSQAPAHNPRMCCVRGCMLPGSIADSTTGASDWFCHLHHGAPYAEQAGITARMHNRRNLFILAGRLKAALPGQPIPDNVVPWLRRHGRNDFADAISRAGQRRTAQALGALMLRTLVDECATPQQRFADPDSKTKAVSDSWHKAVDLVGDLA